MRNWFKRALGALLALCMILGAMPAALAADRSELEGYADWAKESLLYFADNNYLLGDEKGYRPDDDISRVEFMLLLNRVCGYTEKDEDKAAAYTDIGEDWIHDAVAVALKAGYVKGRDDTTMSPRDKITRQEAFLMVARIAGITTEDLSSLADYTDSSKLWDEAKGATAALVADGYVNGYNEGGVKSLKPTINIRRCEAVKLLYGMLDQLNPYTYLYAPLTYAEYWANEGVYAAGNTTSSDTLDSHNETDKGGFDAVARATTNHGLHRGNFQQTATIECEDGTELAMAYWADQTTIVLTDGSKVTFSKGTITKEDGTTLTMKGYTITGIKYVPVAVRQSDLEAFTKDYAVVKNGETLAGGFGEGVLEAYTYTANVTANTNGLKKVTKTADGWSFGPRQTGTDSGLKDVELKTATGTTETVKEYSGSYGEFLRFDITGNYGDLGASMQTVKWTYYGNDSTYTTPVATYGTKFAADDWMHKSMGIQLGLTDSVRCQLPEGTDGSGYWTVTIYALGYADYTAKIQVTADNLPKDATPITEEQKAKLNELVAQAKALVAAGATNTDALNEHIKEAEDMLADKDATKVDAEELIGDLSNLIAAGTPKAETYTGKATVTPDGDREFDAYELTATVTVEGGKITNVTAQGGGADNATYLGYAISGRTKGGKTYTGVPAQLTGKSISDVDSFKIDTVTGATCSSNAILEAVKTAIKAGPAA